MRVTSAVLVLMMLVANPTAVHAATITRIVGGGANVGGGSNTITIPIDTSGSTNVLVCVSVVDRNGSGNLSSVTYNSVAMTQVGSEIAIAGPRYGTAWCRLLATGVNANVVVVRGGTTSDLMGAAGSWSGVAQTGFPDASDLDNDPGAGTSFTGTVTTVADNAWGAVMFVGQGLTPTAGAGTAVFEDEFDVTLFDNNGTTWSPPQPFEMTATFSSQEYGFQMVSFAPAVAGTPATVEEEWWFFFW